MDAHLNVQHNGRTETNTVRLNLQKKRTDETTLGYHNSINGPQMHLLASTFITSGKVITKRFVSGHLMPTSVRFYPGRPKVQLHLRQKCMSLLFRSESRYISYSGGDDQQMLRNTDGFNTKSWVLLSHRIGYIGQLHKPWPVTPDRDCSSDDCGSSAPVNCQDQSHLIICIPNEHVDTVIFNFKSSAMHSIAQLSAMGDRSTSMWTTRKTELRQRR